MKTPYFRALAVVWFAVVVSAAPAVDGDSASLKARIVQSGKGDIVFCIESLCPNGKPRNPITCGCPKEPSAWSSVRASTSVSNPSSTSTPTSTSSIASRRCILRNCPDGSTRDLITCGCPTESPASASTTTKKPTSKKPTSTKPTSTKPTSTKPTSTKKPATTKKPKSTSKQAPKSKSASTLTSTPTPAPYCELSSICPNGKLRDPNVCSCPDEPPATIRCIERLCPNGQLPDRTTCKCPLDSAS